MSVVGFLPFFDDFFGLLCFGSGSVFGFVAFVLVFVVVVVGVVLTLAFAVTIAFAFTLVFELFECIEPDVDGLE